MQGKFLAIFLVLTATVAMAHDKDARFIVEMKASNVKERSSIAQLIHIDSVLDDRVFAIVSSSDLKLLKAHPSISVISLDVLTKEKSLANYYQPFINEIEFPGNDQRYHTYDEMVTELNKLALDHASLAQVFSLGKSVENRDLWAIKITDSAVSDANKKAIVYMGTHHAREHLSTEIPIMFASDLLKNVATDPQLQALLKDVEIYVIPMVNPDGATYDIKGRSYKWWRKNRQHNRGGSYGVDLNRNYGFGWGTGGSSSNPNSDVFMGVAPFSEPETKAIRDFFIAHNNVTIALSFHTFSELILYPWGGRDEGIGGEDEEIFKKMANDMASMNHYTPMQSSELYIASGDTCDWLYGELSVFCFTFELSPASLFEGGFYPGASIIDQVFDDNLEPILYLANLARDPKKVLE